jgi:putative FmdB family regulatory protein
VPLYEYQCDRCGRFEIIRKFADAALKVCPTCGGAVEKLLSSPAIQFKGSGWYVTDYGRKSSGGEGKKDGEKPGSGEAKASSGGSEAKGESKASSGGSEAKGESKDGSASSSSTSKDGASGGTSTK